MMMDRSRPISRASVIAHTGLPPMPSNQDRKRGVHQPYSAPLFFPPTKFTFFYFSLSSCTLEMRPFLFRSSIIIYFLFFFFILLIFLNSPPLCRTVAANPLAEHLRLGMRLMRLDQIIFSKKKKKRKMIRHRHTEHNTPTGRSTCRIERRCFSSRRFLFFILIIF
jgi:hypothetical protein